MAASVSKSCVPDYFRCHISECTQIPPEPINGQRDNGQVEGQINRLKTLKRAMYGRAGIALLRARMLSLKHLSEHTV